MANLKLKGHRFYIDITNQCKVNCSFCMYEHERAQAPKNLVLTSKAKANMDNLINNPETSCIGISGEGEPTNNLKIVYEILKISRGNNQFQIISNGIWLHKKGMEILSRLNKLASEKCDKYLIRISFDSYRYPIIDTKNYLDFFKFALSNKFDRIAFSFRSIKEDQDFTRMKIKELLKHQNISYDLISESPLYDDILVGNQKINIEYKNMVYPCKINCKNIFSIWDYINAIESQYKKPFTFGNLIVNSECVGLSMTIKPDGKIFFYGIEFEPQGNILKDEITINHLKEKFFDSDLITALYSKPFLPVLKKLSSDKALKKAIEEVNNPYWIIRELYKKNKEKFDRALGI